MSTYEFSHAQRFAIWLHHGQACYWCQVPLRMQDTDVDHVIPEHLEGKPTELARTLHLYGLDGSFKINDYCNWLPCHTSCNRSKGGRPLPAAPIVLALLATLAQKAPRVRSTVERIEKDKDRDKIIAKVMVALQNDVVSLDDIRALAEPTGEIDEAPSVPSATGLESVAHHLDRNRWRVVSVSGTIATVTDGRLAGATPIGDTPDPTWTCPNCGSYGPWNGVRCQTCGQMSDPYD